MNTMNNNTNINPVAADAIKTFKSSVRKRRTFKGQGLRTIYALVGSNAQFEKDNRLVVIEDFVKGLRKHNKGTIRDFVVEVLHNAIVAKAEQAKNADKDYTFIMS